MCAESLEPSVQLKEQRLNPIRLFCLLFSVAGLAAIAACGDTSGSEPIVESGTRDSASIRALQASDLAPTGTAQPVATSTPRPTATPTPVPTSTPSPESYYELGKEERNDKIDSAIANLSKAIELKPDYVDAYYLRGLLFAREEDLDRAISDFEEVAKLDPDFPDGKVARAGIYSVRGAGYTLQMEYDKAIVDFERAIELDPDNSDAALGAATAFVLRGTGHLDEGELELAIADFDRAIPEFERIIKSDPGDAEASNILATTYVMRGIAYSEEGFFRSSLADFDMAFADFERALNLDADTADNRAVIAAAYSLRGLLYLENVGDFERAIADLNRSIANFEIALSLDSGNSDAQFGLADTLLQLGIAQSNKGDFVEAIDIFERVIHLYPDDTSFELIRGDARNEISKIEVESNEGIDWSLCDVDLKCGLVEVPADYRNPDAGSIKIAVNVRRADLQDQRIGYLLVNPGGPGASGLEFVQDVWYTFEFDLLDRFDIIGFDPRGVGESEPEFLCGQPGEQLDLLNTIVGEIDTPEEIAVGEAAANLCIESMGPVGGLLHSEYVARDMDEIRKALGAEQISYLGFSYGSTLGVWYATLFPGSVRSMVVDGAANPVDKATSQQERVNQAVEELAAFEESLEQALTACVSSKCPIFNEGDPIGYYERAVEKLPLVNNAAGEVPSAGFLAVLTTLYGEDVWPALWKGLHVLNENDDPAILLELAAFQLGDDVTAPNFTAHVNCLDGLVLYPELDRATLSEDSEMIDDAIAEKLPLIGAIYPSAPNVCLFYDQFAPEPLEGPLDGGGVPILVVGNHTDPATPFGESEELVTETLSNGYLLETAHTSHVVYPDNECVNDYVHRVLIDGEYPERRVSCERED